MNDFKTPADLGIEAAKQDAQYAKEIDYMMIHLKDFQGFVIDSIREGMHEHFPDHMEFLKSALEVYIEQVIDEEDNGMA